MEFRKVENTNMEPHKGSDNPKVQAAQGSGEEERLESNSLESAPRRSRNGNPFILLPSIALNSPFAESDPRRRAIAGSRIPPRPPFFLELYLYEYALQS